MLRHAVATGVPFICLRCELRQARLGDATFLSLRRSAALSPRSRSLRHSLRPSWLSRSSAYSTSTHESDQLPHSDTIASHEHASRDTGPSEPKETPRDPPHESSRTSKIGAKASRRKRAKRGSREVRKVQSTVPPQQASKRELRERLSKEKKTSQERAQTIKEALTGNDNQAGRKRKPRPRAEDAIYLQSVRAADLSLQPIDVSRPSVRRLSHGLDRVLFNPGVYLLQDPRSRVYNFDPYLEKLMPVQDFDFDTLGTFVVPSKDAFLSEVAQIHGKRYVGSTSSMTAALQQFHFLLSNFRPLNFNMLSKEFKVDSEKMTGISRAPNAVFLRWKDGVYAVDADKEFDKPNVLSLMGKFMEKLLTVDKATFEKHHNGQSHLLPKEELDRPEAYHYSTFDDFVVRSQLDAHDSRLPGSGVFDLKTRAVSPIRMDSQNYEWGMGYELRSLKGQWESFEREFYDMARSVMLKYSLQVRLGRMNGIFVAFHNIARMFGFQYMALEDLDLVLHGQTDRYLGDAEMNLSMRLMNAVFDAASKRFPETSLRFHFEARETAQPLMYIFAEPVSEDKVNKIQTQNKLRIEQWEADMLGRTKSSQSGSLDKEPSAKAATDSGSRPSSSPQNDVLLNLDDELTSPLLSGSTEESATADRLEHSGTVPADGDATVRAAHDASSADETASGPGAGPMEDPEAGSEVQPTKDLLAFVLRVQHIVNGETMQKVSKLSADDDYELRYDMAEITGERARTLYEATRRRRQKAHADTDETDPGSKTDDYFIRMLKRLSQKGRDYRASVEQDARNQGAEQAIRMWNDAEEFESSPESTSDPAKSGESPQISAQGLSYDWQGLPPLVDFNSPANPKTRLIHTETIKKLENLLLDDAVSIAKVLCGSSWKQDSTTEELLTSKDLDRLVTITKGTSLSEEESRVYPLLLSELIIIVLVRANVLRSVRIPPSPVTLPEMSPAWPGLSRRLQDELCARRLMALGRYSRSPAKSVLCALVVFFEGVGEREAAMKRLERSKFITSLNRLSYSNLDLQSVDPDSRKAKLKQSMYFAFLECLEGYRKWYRGDPDHGMPELEEESLPSPDSPPILLEVDSSSQVAPGEPQEPLAAEPEAAALASGYAGAKHIFLEAAVKHIKFDEAGSTKRIRSHEAAGREGKGARRSPQEDFEAFFEKSMYGGFD